MLLCDVWASSSKEPRAEVADGMDPEVSPTERLAKLPSNVTKDRGLQGRLLTSGDVHILIYFIE